MWNGYSRRVRIEEWLEDYEAIYRGEDITIHLNSIGARSIVLRGEMVGPVTTIKAKVDFGQRQEEWQKFNDTWILMETADVERIY